jgi:hypothetical protein
MRTFCSTAFVTVAIAAAANAQVKPAMPDTFQ